MLVQCNPFASVYRHAHEILSNHENDSNNDQTETNAPYIVISPSMGMRLIEGGDRRFQNLPTMEEVAAVIPIEYSDRSFRDIVLTLRGNDSLRQNIGFEQHFQCISQTHAAYVFDMTFIKGPLAVDRELLSLFAQTQANLFKNTAFEARDDDFQETPLLRKDKNTRTTLKAVKEDASAPGPSNVVIKEKPFMPTVKLGRILSFMSQKLKLKTYINKRKGTQEIVKRLFDNSKKYGTSSTVGAKNQNLSKIKHVSLPPAELPSSSQRKRIMAF
ncbi:hypothetical protein G6F68_003519 [Rhizopus microsporus]|nr:hypothetical protein G6F67_004217 [Rhizopus microsporus]KAG1265497.1 hypothetical protein G6F68_003519 [Rhizopus microsporus]